MARNYAAIPYDYGREMSCLSDAEFGRLVRALLKYSETGEQMALSGNERFFTDRIMMQEDRFRESYDDLTKARSDAGKAGASKRWQTIANDGKRWQDDGKNGNTETKTETDISATIVADSARTRAEAAFAEFWAEYPKKVGKGAAEKAFRKLKASVYPLLIPAIERQRRTAQWQKDGGQYIPNPATWLNQERWLDEGTDAPAGRPGYRVQEHGAELSDLQKEAVARILGEE